MKTLRLFFQTVMVLVVFVTWQNWRSLEGSRIQVLLPVTKLGDAPEFIGSPHWVVSIAASGRNVSGSSRQSNGRGISWYDSAPHLKSSFMTTKTAYKFFLLAPNEYTSDFIGNYTDRASRYYRNHLNEESAEVWLHRGFENLQGVQGKTEDPNEADAILIAGYFHFNAAIIKRKGNKSAHDTVDHSLLLETYERSLAGIHENVLRAKTKPHLLLIPTWNPSVAAKIGVKALAKRMQNNGFSNLWSVGFERNSMWQGVPIERILPIPYVVRSDESESSSFSPFSRLPNGLSAIQAKSPRISNLVFYVGEARPNAKEWAGCHRDKLISNLKNATLVDVRLVTKHTRLNQSEYNYRMKTSDYCLVLCGDTPTSRSLTSAMVSGCIPVRVGSRLRGLCEPPCHRGYGWQLSGSQYPHLPFPERIPWDLFPEVDEHTFMNDGPGVLSELFRGIDDDHKQKIRSIMRAVKNGWIYGWGDPVNSTSFGDVTEYLWNSFVSAWPTGI